MLERENETRPITLFKQDIFFMEEAFLFFLESVSLHFEENEKLDLLEIKSLLYTKHFILH